MGNSYSSSSTEIIDTIEEIFDENNNETDNQNNNNENQNNNETSSQKIIDAFLKLEKKLRDPENPYFGPYIPYIEDKPKNYCISFIYYYPKSYVNNKKLFPPYFHKKFTSREISEIQYVQTIKDNLKKFYELCSQILKYYHKKPMISPGLENSIILKDTHIECRIDICFFCSDNIYRFLTFLLPYFFPKTCEHSITKILDSINRIQNENCKNKLYEKN